MKLAGYSHYCSWQVLYFLFKIILQLKINIEVLKSIILYIMAFICSIDEIGQVVMKHHENCILSYINFFYLPP